MVSGIVFKYGLGYLGASIAGRLLGPLSSELMEIWRLGCMMS
jgi:hypothetical protein